MKSKLNPDYCELIRTCIFRPYRKGMGPVFRLKIYDINRTGEYGKFIVPYELYMNKTLLFSGEDFCCPIAIDSDMAVYELMAFLTLKEGDTDDDYFKDYTPVQIAYRDEHAESLCCEVMNRFCDENGNVKSRK